MAREADQEEAQRKGGKVSDGRRGQRDGGKRGQMSSEHGVTVNEGRCRERD